MTEREKLTDLLNQNCGYVDEQPASELANHLLENGVIVLPCKLYDTVYIINKNGDESFVEGRITRFSINYKCELVIVIEQERENFYSRGNYKWNSFGKTVFLTREEAEEALKRKDKKSHK